ncbi:MAG: hypothetical protein IKQ25_03110 [Lachnospiraceae bacterium]|nr:hypothetical protein [Lachnospiraceae bacterium]
MTVKTLRRQLAAAIAMTLVSTVALGSSTYAWFVSNNTVTATTASISAQSNAPFLVISNSEITATTADTAVTTGVSDAVLFPVQMIEANDAATEFTWQSAYASAATAATEKASTRFTVQSADLTKYYLKQTFHIGTNGTTQGQFKNLRVSGVTVTVGSGTDNEIENALRIMVVCGEEVAVYDKSGTLVTTYVPQSGTETNIGGLTAAASRSANGVATTAAYLTLENDVFPATSGTISDKTVDVYLYYDGAVANVYTNNLEKLGSVKVALTFTADDAAAPTT